MRKFKIIIIMLCFSLVLSYVFPFHSVILANAETEQRGINIGKGKYGMLSVNNKKEGAEYTWYSNNTKVVTVDNAAFSLTGIKPGTATISCKETLNGKTKTVDSFMVAVKTPEFDTSPITAYADEIVYSILDILYKNPSAEYRYTSSNPKIATVDIDSGVIKTKAVGTVTITVTEILNKKTKTIGKVTVKVLDNKYSLSTEPIELVIDNNYSTDNEIRKKSYIPYRIQSKGYGTPTVSYKVENTSICKIVDNAEIKPLKIGKTNLICTITENGKSRILGKVPIQVRAVNPEKDYWLKRNTRLDEKVVSIIEQKNGDINLLIDSNIPRNLLKFTSSNPSIIDINTETGEFVTLAVGKAEIIVEGAGKKLIISVTVLDLGPKEDYFYSEDYEQEMNKIYQEIEDLDLNEISSDTLVECYKKANRIFYSINGGFFEFYYSFYRYTPNLTRLLNYIKALREIDPLYEKLSMIQHNIKNVTVKSPKELEVELDIPFFDLELVQLLYFNADGFDGDLSRSCHIEINVNGFKDIYQAAIDLKPNTNVLKVTLYRELPKGTHTISYGYSSSSTKFTYK